MTEQKLRNNIRKLLFENNWTGSDNEEPPGNFNLSDDPISPENQMSTQLSVALPPVDDEEYMPVNPSELSKALEALFKDTPEDQVGYVYKQAHKLRAFAEEKTKNFRVADPAIDDTVPLDKPVRKSTKIPKKVKKENK